MQPLVSIIVPSYNQGKYLADALNSILNQGYTNWECIIINDGSTDCTEEVALEFCKNDKRFIYYSQNNQGVSVARNKGLAVSKGEFIQFLDGDDLLQSEKIAYQVSFLNSHTEVDIVYGSSRYFFDENKNDLYPIHFRAFAPVVEMDYRDKFQKDVLLSMNICTMCATLYRRKVIEKVNVFKPVPFEDWLFHIECSLNDFRFHYERYNDGYCLIRITEQSQMERHHRANNIKDDFFEKYRQLIYKYDYSSKLINKRSVLEGGDTKDNILLRVLNNITPPVFFKIVKFFRK